MHAHGLLPGDHLRQRYGCDPEPAPRARCVQLLEGVQKRLGSVWNGGNFELWWGFSGGVLQRDQVVTLGGAILSAPKKPELRPDMRG